jgi:uncharacterized protein YecE (DUF72 family)
MKEMRIGCSGWNYAHWREVVYPKGMPPKRWLTHYATMFDTVEVNSTFYRLPKQPAVQGWVEQTPDDFVFAVKASRYLTHIKRLASFGPGVELFYERIEPLVSSGKLGPILWQLPANFHRDDDRLGTALDALPPGRHCFEFRHPSWFVPDVYELLRRRGAALVIGDTPQRPFQANEFTAGWTFVRFHHGRRGRNGNYSPSEIEEWATRIRKWRRSLDVYAYFNNDWSGYAVRNALDLRHALARPRAAPRRRPARSSKRPTAASLR